MVRPVRAELASWPESNVTVAIFGSAAQITMAVTASQWLGSVPVTVTAGAGKVMFS